MGINGSDRISPLSYVSRIERVFTYAFGSENQTLKLVLPSPRRPTPM